MKFTVQEIFKVVPNDFNGLSKVQFSVEGRGEVIYMYCKPGNEPKAGDELEGELTDDKAGKKKFTKAKQQQFAGTAASQERKFKADPEKMAQDRILEIAKNKAIMRQVAVKGAVELITNSKVEYASLHQTYAALMELLDEPDWTKFQVKDNVITDDIENFNIEEALLNVEEDNGPQY